MALLYSPFSSDLAPVASTTKAYPFDCMKCSAGLCLASSVNSNNVIHILPAPTNNSYLIASHICGVKRRDEIGALATDERAVTSSIAKGRLGRWPTKVPLETAFESPVKSSYS